MPLSPMMQQYMSVKEQNLDSILFFRLGDFYEMFFDDAKLASKELELVLTGRDCGQEERAPMCGVPHHSCEAYIARLVAKGYKVAICEQTEDAKDAVGIVNRDVVRVITPGTVIEESMLEEQQSNYLCVIAKHGKTTGMCFVDISTGSLRVTEISDDKGFTKLFSEVLCLAPREIIVNFENDELSHFTKIISAKINTRIDKATEELFCINSTMPLVLEHFNIKSLSEIGIEDNTEMAVALCATLKYLKHTILSSIESIREVEVYSTAKYMRLDFNTQRNLELLVNANTNTKKGSLISVLDKTKTAMGKRKLVSIIEQPLINAVMIDKRFNAVEELYKNSETRENLRDYLNNILDLERITTRINSGIASARELVSFKEAIMRLPQIKDTLAPCTALILRDIYEKLDTLDDLFQLIDKAIINDPPLGIRDGGIIKTGYNAEIDEIRSDVTGGKDILFEVEQREKLETGIKNLKVGYNKVFGYFIEVTNSYKNLVPEHYIRKQTLTGCERYITEELKVLENRIVGANDRIIVLEYNAFDEVRSIIAKATHRIQITANAIADLDVLQSFAVVALNNNYIRPNINNNGIIDIKDGRHPVVETLTSEPFVPNDTFLDINDNRMAIITGPNMAGKSTYMRQVAVITLMCQIGSFVPASYANIGITDIIFTRVGASDNLSTGESTFMVEMNEVAYILKNATKNSLIIYDEVGRGTSTFDGMSIARAVLEYTANPKKIGAKTLFATHYHELSDMQNLIPGVKNYSIAAKKKNDEIIFLRRIVAGAADDSYGIEVAKLAGVPNEVIFRAKEILLNLESNEINFSDTKADIIQEESMQTSFSQANQSSIINDIADMDINTLTPIESLKILNDLIIKAKNNR